MENISAEYELAGFTGAYASTDYVNIVFDKLPWIYLRQHLGYKQFLTARSYNVTINHRRRMLHSTQGFPARWNDKTVVKFDQFLNDVRINKRFKDHIFVYLKEMRKVR